MSTTRFFIYIRKSTESEDRQKLSLPAQEEVLRKIAKDRSLTIIGEPIRESMSAKRPGRPLFTKMLDDIRKKKADGILCWHLDRLSRNPVDGGAVIWAVDQGEIREIVTAESTFTRTPDDKLMMSIVFGMATKYSDDLGRNVKRGTRQALERGFWPGRPKLGYLRDNKTKRLIPDTERFSLVQEIWKLCLDGVPVAEVLGRTRNEWGLRTLAYDKRGGHPLSVSGIYRLLRDPFYAGVMVHGGTSYPGSHPPMISWKQFEEMQSRIDGHAATAPREKQYSFTYGGLLVCGRCHARVTAEHKTQRHGHRYVYYHCARKNRRFGFCPEISIEEREMTEQIDAFLSRIALPESLMQAGLNEIRRLMESDAATTNAAAEKLAALRARSVHRLARLRALCADGKISDEELTQDREQLLAEQRALDERIESLRHTDRLIEPLGQAISYASKAIFSFRETESEEKRAIVRTVSSNLVLMGRKVLIEAKLPFSLFLDVRTFPQLKRRLKEARTSYLWEGLYLSSAQDNSKFLIQKVEPLSRT